VVFIFNQQNRFSCLKKTGPSKKPATVETAKPRGLFCFQLRSAPDQQKAEKKTSSNSNNSKDNKTLQPTLL